ncbi:MAG: glutathione S-transferase C-terminal domain-containing protein, partial [Polyangiaceae bacterium]
SCVICEYLDSLHGGRKLVPPSGDERWRTLKLQALCDGILDSAILAFYEGAMRPKELHWTDWIDGQCEKARQGLESLERECSSFGSDVDLGQICVGVTFGWLEFRKPLGDIRSGHPKLTRWYEAFRERPSMRATEPSV